MSKFEKGNNPNRHVKTKTAFMDDDPNILHKIKKVKIDALIYMEDKWVDVIEAMYRSATHRTKPSVPAATWLRDTFLGKPKEQVELDTKSNEINLNYSLSPLYKALNPDKEDK